MILPEGTKQFSPFDAAIRLRHPMIILLQGASEPSIRLALQYRHKSVRSDGRDQVAMAGHWAIAQITAQQAACKERPAWLILLESRRLLDRFSHELPPTGWSRQPSV